VTRGVQYNRWNRSKKRRKRGFTFDDDWSGPLQGGFKDQSADQVQPRMGRVGHQKPPIRAIIDAVETVTGFEQSRDERREVKVAADGSTVRSVEWMVEPGKR